MKKNGKNLIKKDPTRTLTLSSSRKLVIKQDINLLEYPLWFQDERSKPGSIWQDKEGYTYIAGRKLPTKVDILFLYYLVLQQQQKRKREKLILSRCKMLRDCGVQDSNHWYQRLEESLDRWMQVEVKFDGTFYADGIKLEKVSFGIINDWGIEEGTKRLWVCLSPLFLTRLENTKYFKLVEFNTIKALRSPLAIRLYEILSKSFKDRDTWLIDAMKLARKIPMAEKYPSDVIPKLNAALNRINKESAMRFEMSVDRPERGKATLTFTTVKQKKQPQITGIPKKFQSLLQELLPLVREKDRERQSVKIAIVKAFQGYELEAIRWSIECANAQSKRNYAAFFTNVLRNDYWLKQKEDKEEERKQRDKREAAIRAEYEKQKQEEAKRARKRAEHDRAVAIITEKSAEEVETLRHEARKRMIHEGIKPDIVPGVITDIYMQKIVLERESA
jgi:hypothetical protein